MNIKEYLLDVLKSKEIIDLLPNKKVYFLHASSTKDNPLKKPYLEYEIINEFGCEYSEGNEDFTCYIVQVDIFSTGDYTELESIVKKHMINNGFNRDMAADLYEKDTQLYHCAMRFNISLSAD